ncbi:MAG: 50S ribosomal protein L31 [Candidatus Andersenbacteria bacterium]
MKAKVHPEYHDDVKVTCACGTTWATGSTLKAINVEICSACHPFYTGTSRLLDTAGRVDKFRTRTERSKVLSAAKAARDKAREEKLARERELAKRAKSASQVLSTDDKR